MKARPILVFVLIALLAAACAPVPAPAPLPASNATAAQPAAPAPMPAVPPAGVTPAVIPAGWQVYTNPMGFAISYPATWTAQAQPPDSNNSGIQTDALQGPEGEVDLSWGVGFGGACPSGATTVKVAQGDIQTCYQKNASGTESWTQMSHPLPNTGFQGRASTRDAQPASHDMILQIVSTLTFAPMPAATQPAGGMATAHAATAPAGAGAYTDPFAYCAAVGMIDTPDARYTGPKTPASILPPGPWPFPEGSAFWRCMDGDVYACYVGANTPCWTKANTSITPTPGMQNFCKDQPNADNIPAYAAGHETIYAWSCKNGAAVIGKQMFQIDAQGYITPYWNKIQTPAASPAAPVPATAGPAGSPAATLQPLSPAACAAMAGGMAKTLGVKGTTGEAPISDWTTQRSGTGCQATATGTGGQFKSPAAVVKALGDMLVGMGWTEDMQLQAGGPTGMGDGYRKDGALCLTNAGWWPSADANCPKDQPISACNVTPAQQQYTITLNCAQSAATAAAPPVAGMANPASVNCTKQRGTLSIQTNGAGGQYGVCTFDDNRQCEEWALMRSDCPVGGVKVTGYATPAAQYCAITGGTYTNTGNNNTPNETGACTLKNGKTCDATAYWNGGC